MSEVVCGECGSPMKLIRSRHTDSQGQARYFFGCSRFPACNGRHGADAWGKPMGIPANAETNKARHESRSAFDTYWHERKWSRSAGYRWLTERLKVERNKCSFAMFDLATCNHVVDIIQQARKRHERKQA